MISGARKVNQSKVIAETTRLLNSYLLPPTEARSASSADACSLFRCRASRRCAWTQAAGGDCRAAAHGGIANRVCCSRRRGAGGIGATSAGVGRKGPRALGSVGRDKSSMNAYRVSMSVDAAWECLATRDGAPWRNGFHARGAVAALVLGVSACLLPEVSQTSPTKTSSEPVAAAPDRSSEADPGHASSPGAAESVRAPALDAAVMLGDAGPVPSEADASLPAEQPSASDDGTSFDHTWADWPVPNSQEASDHRPSYSVAAQGATVMDLVTQLVWQRDLPVVYEGCSGSYGPGDATGSGCSWAEATSYCARLALDNEGIAGSWRVPTKIELESLIDETRFDPAIDPTFRMARPDAFWTAASSVGREQSAWYVIFNYGYSAEKGTESPYRVRCVR